MNESLYTSSLLLVSYISIAGHNSEEVSMGLFARVCVEVDISKPLKRNIKYFRDGNMYECLLDCENITNICFGCGSQSHRFDTCMFNSKSIIFKVEKLSEVSSVADSLKLKDDEKTKSQESGSKCFTRNWETFENGR